MTALTLPRGRASGGLANLLFINTSLHGSLLSSQVWRLQSDSHGLRVIMMGGEGVAG